MRDYILVYINGKRFTIPGHQAMMNASDYLRYELNLKGTKIVCAEGDCGACTVLRHFYYQDISFGYLTTVNSCIIPMFLLDCNHLITVEGLGDHNNLHPIQEAMVDCHGSQCGYCTPGFVVSLYSLFNSFKKQTSWG